MFCSGSRLPCPPAFSYSPPSQPFFMNLVNFFYDKPVLPLQDYSLAFTNPLLFVDKFIKQVETRIDEPEVGGMWCALLSNYYFLLKHSDKLTNDEKQIFSDKSLDMLNKVYEKNCCKGFLMLTFLYSAERESEKLGSAFQMLIREQQSHLSQFLGSSPTQNIQRGLAHLFGFCETSSVKQEKALENLFKALKLDSNKTLEFLKLFPDLNGELIKTLTTENQNLETKVEKLESQIDELEMEPSFHCPTCSSEVGGGSLFKQAKDRFNFASTQSHAI